MNKRSVTPDPFRASGVFMLAAVRVFCHSSCGSVTLSFDCLLCRKADRLAVCRSVGSYSRCRGGLPLTLSAGPSLSLIFAERVLSY